ncbi:MAG: hypothetical protein LBQ00_05370 [Syntrophobacterales bacterium]|nr:hypothetical protein [Syntrophobacterales bacterium]
MSLTSLALLSLRFENAEEFKRYIDDLQQIEQELLIYKDKNSDFYFCQAGIYKNERLIVTPTSKDDLAKLQNSLKEVESIQKWAIQVAADGKQGEGFKERWLKLKKEIECVYKFSRDCAADSPGKIFKHSPDTDKQEALQLLTKLSKILAKGKIGIGAFLFKPSLKNFYKNTTINGVKLKTSAECDVFKNYIDLELQRKDLAKLWNDLMTSFGVPKFESFGKGPFDKGPEETAKNYCPKIDKYLDWHDIEHPNIMQP